MDESVIFVEELRHGDSDLCVCESSEPVLMTLRPRKKSSTRQGKKNKPPICFVDLSRDSGNFNNQESSSKDADKENMNPKRTLNENFKLKENNRENQKNCLECPVCLESMQNLEIQITPCGHLFCKSCMDLIIKEIKPKCPKCRRVFLKNTIGPVYL